MITLDKWNILTPEEVMLSDKVEYENAYTGFELELDERSKWTGDYSKKIAKNNYRVEYSNNSAELIIAQKKYSVKDFAGLPVSSARLLFDATTLPMPELLYCMFWANLTKQNFDVVYMEPNAYSATYKSKIGSHNPDFSLSEDGPGLFMLPRFIVPINKSHMVVALGYEGHRFGSLLISDEITPERITGVLGVPPFVLGWEKNSFSKNFQLMNDAKRTKFKATAANDPIQNYRLIQLIYDAAQITNARVNRTVHLVPIGTKPVALAMVWFAINHNGTTGILYDFIKKIPKRTEGLGKVHFWRFSVT